MAIIDRAGAETLINAEMSREIMSGLTSPDTANGSVVLKLGRRLSDMSSRQMHLPVTSLLPVAYWQDGADLSAKDIAAKRVTAAAWDKVTLTAEELAVIVLISENTLDDSDCDIWSYIRPLIIDAFGEKIDSAVLFGTGAPNGSPTALVTAATTAGNVITAGAGDAYDELLGSGGLISLIENSGYVPNGHIGRISTRGYLRGIRDDAGQPLFRPMSGMGRSTRYELDGVGVHFPANGVMENSDTMLITGDFNQLVYSIRQDITMKLLDQATVVDGANTYHLAQQDMIGLRVKMRLAWATPNPVTRIKPTFSDDSRFPFAVLNEATS
ncbi:phage capsid protein [Clostridia bacterium]|nr:phage capsid protein [Clostridia bacterium]